MGAKREFTEAEALEVGRELARLRNDLFVVGNKILSTTTTRSPLAASVHAAFRAVYRLRSKLENDVARAHGNDVALRVTAGEGSGQ